MANQLERWNLRLDGEPAHGLLALVPPVITSDGTAAALKLQPVTAETIDEPTSLRLWNGNGAARLLNHDPSTGTMLLERLDADCPLSTVRDDAEAVRFLAELLARLGATPAPNSMRRLADIATTMVERTPQAAAALPDADDRRLSDTCAATVRDLLDEPGNQLLHWDLHYDNVLAGDREPCSPSTRNHSPATQRSNCFPLSSTDGMTSSPPEISDARSSAGST